MASSICEEGPTALRRPQWGWGMVIDPLALAGLCSLFSSGDPYNGWIPCLCRLSHEVRTLTYCAKVTIYKRQQFSPQLFHRTRAHCESLKYNKMGWACSVGRRVTRLTSMKGRLRSEVGFVAGKTKLFIIIQARGRRTTPGL
ncbi:hypothetical protein NC651_031780 [Populus alba x Populus x berolinensis]|nr:hypothetical protein NC651_031780 [Populus alba x Populus x berolinensis]